MTPVRGLILGMALLVITPTLLHAQKIGYVASAELFARVPQAVEARTKLDELQSKWLRELQRQEQDIAQRQKEIEQNRLLWSLQEREQKEGELRQIQGKVALFRNEKFGPGGEFEVRYRELMDPVITLIQAAIRAEADAQEYDFIFDKSSRGMPMLVTNTEYDLTYDVLKRLGVEVDPSELATPTPSSQPSLLDQLPDAVRVDGNPRFDVNAPVKVDTSIDRGNTVPAEVHMDPNRLLTPETKEEDPE